MPKFEIIVYGHASDGSGRVIPAHTLAFDGTTEAAHAAVLGLRLGSPGAIVGLYYPNGGCVSVSVSMRQRLRQLATDGEG